MPKKKKRQKVFIENLNMEKEVVVLSDMSLCRIYEWLDENGDYCAKRYAEAVIFVTPWHSVHTAAIEDVRQTLH